MQWKVNGGHYFDSGCGQCREQLVDSCILDRHLGRIISQVRRRNHPQGKCHDRTYRDTLIRKRLMPTAPKYGICLHCQVIAIECTLKDSQIPLSVQFL